MSVVSASLLLGGEAAPAPPAPTGLLAFWNLENDGDDGLGVSDMTATNITFDGTSATFNASNSSLITPASALLDVVTDMTISCWLYATDASNYYSAVNHMVGGGGGNNVNYHLILFPGSLLTLHTQSDSGIGSVFLPLNTWVHIVVTRDTAGNVEFFKDGTSVQTGTGPAPYSKPTATTQIGSRADAYSYWHGSIRRVGIWGRILTGAEVSYLYNGGSGRAYPDVP